MYNVHIEVESLVYIYVYVGSRTIFSPVVKIGELPSYLSHLPPLRSRWKNQYNHHNSNDCDYPCTSLPRSIDTFQFCQIDREHLKNNKISFDTLNTLVTRTFRFLKIFFLSVLHDQTSVESLSVQIVTVVINTANNVRKTAYAFAVAFALCINVPLLLSFWHALSFH